MENYHRIGSLQILQRCTKKMINRNRQLQAYQFNQCGVQSFGKSSGERNYGLFTRKKAHHKQAVWISTRKIHNQPAVRLTVINDWVAYLCKGGDIDVVYTDFKKAFDSVPHKRLLLKLARCGFSGQMLNWTTACRNQWCYFILVSSN